MTVFKQNKITFLLNCWAILAIVALLLQQINWNKTNKNQDV